MSPARRIALVLVRMSFRFLLVTLISLVAFFTVFGTSDDIKRVLTDTKAYDRFVPAILEANQKDPDGKPSIFKDPAVRKIASDAFTPTTLQKESESFIDAWYIWLDGRSSEPQYLIDFSDSRQQMADKLSMYGINRLSSLPVCSTLTAEASLDPFRATCQPPGVNYQLEQTSLKNELMNSQDFLPKVTYTALDLPKTKDGQTIPQAFTFAPFIFGMLWYIMWALTLIVLLLGLTTVLLRRARRQAWKQLGRSLFSTGLFLGISGYVFGLLVPKMTHSFQSQFSGNGTNQIVNDVIQQLTISFQTVFINICIVITLIGLVILVLVKALKPTSRYEGLEKITGLVSGVRPKRTETLGKRAGNAPVVTSERKSKRSVAKQPKRKARASKEVV